MNDIIDTLIFMEQMGPGWIKWRAQGDISYIVNTYSPRVNVYDYIYSYIQKVRKKLLNDVTSRHVR